MSCRCLMADQKNIHLSWLRVIVIVIRRMLGMLDTIYRIAVEDPFEGLLSQVCLSRALVCIG